YYYEYKKLKLKLLTTATFFWVFLASVSVVCIITIFSSFFSDVLFDTTNYSLLIKLVAIQIPFYNLNILGFIVLRYDKQNLIFIILILFKVFILLFLVYLFVIVWEIGMIGVFLSQFLAACI